MKAIVLAVAAGMSAGACAVAVDSFSRDEKCAWKTEAAGWNLTVKCETGVEDEDGTDNLKVTFRLKDVNKTAGDGRWFFVSRAVAPDAAWREAEAFELEAKSDTTGIKWYGISFVDAAGNKWSPKRGWQNFPPEGPGHGAGVLNADKYAKVTFPFGEMSCRKLPGAKFDPMSIRKISIDGGAFADALYLRNFRLVPKEGAAAKSAEAQAARFEQQPAVEMLVPKSRTACFSPGDNVELEFALKPKLDKRVTAIECRVSDYAGRIVRTALMDVRDGERVLRLDLGTLPKGWYEAEAYAVREDGAKSAESVLETWGSMWKGKATFAVMHQTAEENVKQIRERKDLFFGIQNDRMIGFGLPELLGTPWTITMPRIEWSETKEPALDAEGRPDWLRDFTAKRKAYPDYVSAVCSFVHYCSKEPWPGKVRAESVDEQTESGKRYMKWMGNAVKQNMHLFPHMEKRPYEPAWEEDLGFPPRGTTTMKGMVGYFREAYKAIHAADPKATVWGPKCTHNLGWFEEALKAGMGRYMDEISMHFYIGPVPEEANIPGALERIRSLCRKYIGKELPIHNTEGGYHLVPDVQTHTARLLRYAILQKAAGMKTFLLFYIFDHGENKNCIGWGMFFNPKKDPHANWFSPDRLFPKPIVPAYSMLAKMLSGYEAMLDISKYDAGFCGYVFRRGNDTVAPLWQPYEKVRTVFPVGDVKEVTVVDIFGNERKVRAKNGHVELTLSPDPVYLLGTDVKFWEEAGKSTVKELAAGERFGNLRLGADATPGLMTAKADGRLTFVKVPRAVTLKTANARRTAEGMAIDVKFGNSSAAAAETQVSLNTVAGKDAKRLKIAAKGEGTVTFGLPAPKSGFNPAKPISGTLEWRSGGAKMREKVSISFLRACPPGKNGDGLFTNKVSIKGNSADGGNGDATCEFVREEEGLRIRIEVNDKVHEQTRSGDWLWDGDSVQLGFCTNPDYGYEYDEMIAQTKKKPTMITVALKDGKVEGYRHKTYSEKFLAKGKLGATALGKTRIVHKGGKTAYDILLPWREIGLTRDEVKPGAKLGFALLINDRDGNGTNRTVTEFFKGINDGTGHKHYGAIAFE